MFNILVTCFIDVFIIPQTIELAIKIYDWLRAATKGDKSSCARADVMSRGHVCRHIQGYAPYFYAPGLKGPPGASSDWIVRLSVCPSVCLSVRNSVPLSNKVQYLKFGWWYSNQTWTVSSSIGSSHFTDIPCPWGWGGRGQNVGLRDFLPYLDFVAAGGIRVSQTHV